MTECGNLAVPRGGRGECATDAWVGGREREREGGAGKLCERTTHYKQSTRRLALAARRLLDL